MVESSLNDFQQAVSSYTSMMNLRGITAAALQGYKTSGKIPEEVCSVVLDAVHRYLEADISKSVEEWVGKCAAFMCTFLTCFLRARGLIGQRCSPSLEQWAGLAKPESSASAHDLITGCADSELFTDPSDMMEVGASTLTWGDNFHCAPGRAFLSQALSQPPFPRVTLFIRWNSVAQHSNTARNTTKTRYDASFVASRILEIKRNPVIESVGMQLPSSPLYARAHCNHGTDGMAAAAQAAEALHAHPV